MRPVTDAHPLAQRQNQTLGLTRLSLGPPKNAQHNPLTGRSLVQAVCLCLGTKARMNTSATSDSMAWMPASLFFSVWLSILSALRDDSTALPNATWNVGDEHAGASDW